jgi:hypothetical protein
MRLTSRPSSRSPDWAAIAIENARRHGGVRGQRDEFARAVETFETAEEIGLALAG